MTATELFKLAMEAQERGQTTVMVNQPGKWGNRTYCHLAGRGSPRGVIVTDTVEPGRLLVRYDAEEIMRYVAPTAQYEIETGRVVLAVEDSGAEADK